MQARQNGITTCGPLTVEHSDDAGVIVWRTADPDKSASLTFAIECGRFSDDTESPLRNAEIAALDVIERVYSAAGLY